MNYLTQLTQDSLVMNSASSQPLEPAFQNNSASIFPDINSGSSWQTHASLVFVDSSIQDVGTLLKEPFPPNTEIHFLDSGDAIAQITNTVMGRSGITSIHIISHGSMGGIQLGQDSLTLANLPTFAAQIQSWGNSLTDDADILLYGCNVGNGELGQAFVSILSQLTKADIAASNDLTGSSNLGGNWTLEVATGAIESALVISPQAQSTYGGLLASTQATNLNIYIPTLGSNPSRVVDVNGTLYFSADDGVHGNELWKIDSSGNASLVKDINSSSYTDWLGNSYPYSSSPSNLTNVNGTLYFTADDGVHGNELWKVEGNGNAVLVADIRPGSYYGSNPSNLIDVNGTLYFTADDGVHGNELWKVDGNGSAVLVADIRPGSYYGSNPSNLTNVNGTLFFKASLSDFDVLWKVDSSGRVFPVEYPNNPNSPYRNISNLTNVNGTLYLTAYDSVHGDEVWKIDSNGKSVLVSEIDSGQYGSSPSNLTNVNGTLYFTAFDKTHGNELWKVASSGIAVLVKDIYSGNDGYYPFSSSPANLTNVSGSLYFTANDGVHGNELWKVDSSGNAILVKDIYSGNDGSYPFSSSPSNLTNVNGTLYFTAYDSVHGNELWKVDSSGNAILVKDIDSSRYVDWLGNSYPNSSYPGNLTNINGVLYFTASDYAHGSELWKIGADGNPVLAKDINVSVSSAPGGLTKVKGDLYFTATDGTYGAELWRINSSNKVEVIDLNPGIQSSDVSNLTVVNGTLYFTANDGIHGNELWRINSSGQPVLIKDIYSGILSSSPGNLTNVNGTLYFTAWDGVRTELWKINSYGEAVLVSGLSPGYGGSYPGNLTNVNGTLYFTAWDGTHGNELWKVNSNGEVVLVKDIYPGYESSSPSNLNSVNGTLYFAANDGVHGNELWKIDNNGNAVLAKNIYLDSSQTSVGLIASNNSSYGNINTSESNSLENDISPMLGFPPPPPPYYSSDPQSLTNVNGVLYFTAIDGVHGRELWKVDQSGNVSLAKDIYPGGYWSSPSNLTNVNGTLYFIAEDGVYGRELWRVDKNGTVSLAKDIYPDSNGSNPNLLTGVNDTLYFTANDGTHGSQLWKVSGNSDAVLADDISSSVKSSEYYNPTAINGAFYFFAPNSEPELQLWEVNNAPVLDNSGSPSLLPVTYANPNPAGTTIATFIERLGNSITDPDGSSLKGIALTGVDSAQGVWQYSTNAGATWANVGSVSDSQALLLAASSNNRLRFIPNSNFLGSLANAITFRAWDQTSGLNGTLADTTSNGGATAFSTATETASIAVVPMRSDFDNNGYTDILWRNYSTGANQVWLMNGTTYLESRLLTQVPKDSGWLLCGSGDFDGDGDADILWRNSISGQNGVWLMNGTTMEIKLLTPVPANSGWVISGVGDFDGDGDADILWQKPSTGETGVWIMNGTTLATAKLMTPIAPNSGWAMSGTGDFNHDGQTDILWRNYTTGQNGVWFMNGTTFVESSLLTYVPPDSGWVMSGAGDFNRDGYSDILWRNYTTGANGIWLMNGTTITSIDTTPPSRPTNSGWAAIV